MKLEGIILEGTSQEVYRINKAIERLPENTIKNSHKEKGKSYLKATINKKDDLIIDLQCLDKETGVYIPEKAEMIKHDLEGKPISFFYLKTPYNIIY